MGERSKIIIYGGGIRGKRLCKIIWESGSDIEIAAVADSNPELWGTMCYGHEILNPDEVFDGTSIDVCIAVTSENSVRTIKRTLMDKYHCQPESFVDYISFLLLIWETSGKKSLRAKPRDPTGKDINIIYDLHQGLALGGGESWTRAVCLGLREHGWQRLCICANEDRYRGKEIPDEWMELSSMVDCIGNDPNEPYAERPTQNTFEYLAGKMPCVIVASYVETLCAACVLKRMYPDQVRIIDVIHGGTRDIYNSHIKLQGAVDAYIGVSRDIQQAMIEREVEKSKVLLMKIPFSCGEKIDRFYREDSTYPIRLGFAGRVQIYPKRMDLLLKLIGALLDRKVNFKLEIAGAGNFEGTMRAFITERRLENQVRVIGQLPREEIPAFWKRQDVCVNLSDFEGRSISITEAMGNGAVPVVTDVSGVRDDIVDGVNGFIVPVGGVEEMADRIEYLSKHRELLRPMGTAAHDEVYPKSLMEPHVRFWEELLTRMTDSLRA